MKKIKFFALIAALFLSLGVKAAWTGSGEGTKVDGVWYVYQHNNEIPIALWSNTGTLNLAGPGAKVIYQAKRQTAAFNAGFIPQYSTNGGSNWTSLDAISVGTSYSDKSFDLPVDANCIRWKHDSPGSLTKYVKNIKVTMAKYLENPSETTLAFGSKTIGAEAETKTFTVAWCNVPAMSWSVTGEGASDIEVSANVNAAEGKYNTTTFTVKYKRSAVGNLNASLVITDSYNSYSQTVTLTGATQALTQTLSWDVAGDVEILNTDALTETATATSGLAATYSSSDESVVKYENGAWVIVGVGEATIYADQAGNETYAAAAQISKKVTVSLDPTSAEAGEIAWSEKASGDYYYTATPTGKHGTICLPYNCNVEGAYVYEYVGAEKEGDYITGLVFDYINHDKSQSMAVEAGKAYVYFATADTQTWEKVGDEAADINTENGFTGTYTSISVTNHGYGLFASTDMFHPLGNATIPVFRAYIEDLGGLVAADAPIRAIFPTTSNPIVTGVENAECKMQSAKCIVNGRLVIKRGEHMYDLNGAKLK